jgi:DNA-binding NtrC family response regulator
MSRNAQNSLRGRRVLIAEDEFLIGKLIGRMLRHHECTVVGPAHSLSEALQAIRTSDIDAAVLDVQLGDADVYPAAKELELRNIPFVVATGYRDLDGSPELLRDAPRLTKPFNEQQLVDILTSSFVRRH